MGALMGCESSTSTWGQDSSSAVIKRRNSLTFWVLTLSYLHVWCLEISTSGLVVSHRNCCSVIFRLRNHRVVWDEHGLILAFCPWPTWITSTTTHHSS